MSFNRWHVLLVLVFTIASPALGARVTVEPAQSVVYMGQTLTLLYRLSDTADAAAPPALAIDGCSVRYTGIQSNTQINFNGNRRTETLTFSYTYDVRPLREGSFTSPPLIFDIPGGPRVTAPVATFISAKAPFSPDFQLEIKAHDQEVYIGQPVRVTWTWTAAQRVAGAEIIWPEPDGAEVFVAAASNPNSTRGANVTSMMGKEAALKTDQRTIDGRRWNVYTVELVVVPTRAGRLKLPGSSVLIEADTGRRRRGVSVFDTRTITETFSAEADGPVIRVRELPAESRPANFTGLIGNYRIETTASPTNVRVGDPINLTIVIRGPEAAVTQPEIDLPNLPGFAGVFRIDTASDSTYKIRGGTVIKHTLRAQRDNVSTIPPIELPYFDPALGRYAIARSAPLPLEVAPTRIVTLADAMGEFDEDTAGAPIESRDGGLRANVTGHHALRSERFDALAAIKDPVIIGLLAVPPGAFAIASVLVFMRSRRTLGADARASRRALPRALDSLKRAPNPEHVAEAVRHYLSTRFPEAGAAVTPGDVTELFRSASPAAAELAAVLAACDAARFGGAEADTDALASLAAKALRILEKGASS